MRSRVPAGRLVAVLAATAACGAGAIASAATSDFSASQRATIDVAAAKKAKKKPDLTAKALASAPAKVARKGHLTISATVGNTGKRKAGKSILGVYLAHARVHAKGDAQIGLLAVPALRPRRKKKLTAALTVPATLAPGKYFVIACADATKKVKEKSERNNCRTTTTATTVTAPQKPPPKPPPDLPGSDKPVPKPPPPPSAPPLTAPGGSTMKDSTKFLYEGANPVQTGVSAGTIDAARVGVIRGRVLKDDGTPLPSVTVTVAGHPALGQTVTRSDGRYDLAINAGGPVTLHFERPTYLPVERQVDPPVRDYDAVDDVVMRQFDAKVTPLTPGAADAQVARSSTTTDSSGSRRANLILMPGTHASMKMPDNSTKPLSSLHVRATEYTTGSRGPEAMPGDLPPTSAYTYAVDYSVDEAVDAGAKTVLFDQPVVVYTDNFIGMPVGTTVPLGSYDQTKHAWVPEANGIVLKIVSITGGAADVDVDGDGAADTGTKLTDLGITDTERVQLAKLYSAGASLWRASVTHFSALDQNWPWGPPGGAGGPGGPNGAGGPNGGGGRGGGGRGGDPSPNCSPPSGSAIDCGYQALRESLEVAGTPFTLNYTSARAPRASQRQIVIPLTSATPPGPLKRVELDVETAGQATHLQFDGAPNQTYTYEWNGRDAYGRTLNTTTNSLITIAYVYDAVYRTTPLSQAFAQYGDSLSAVKARKEVKFTAQYLVKVGTPPSPPAGLGGWTLDVHHALDTQAELVQLGTGDTMAAPARHQSRLLVNYQDEYDPGTESQATISAPVWQPDGSIWFEETHYTFSSEHHAFVKRVAPDGTISTIASFPDAAYPGYNDAAMTRAPDGGVYVMFRPNNGETPVLHVAPGGDVTPVTAGTLNGSDSPTPNAGDGQPAAQVVLDSPQTLATGPDGSLYIAERVAGPGARIQKIEPDGVLRTVLTPSSASPAFFAVGPDGSLYIGDGEIHRIDPSGRDEIVLGDHSGGTICCAPGQVAKDAALPSSYMRGLAVQNDGTLVFSNGDFIWTVDAQGKLVRLAGRTNGASITDLTPKEAALGASFGSAGMTVGPNGSLAVAAPYGLRTIEPAVGGFALDHLIPSRNGQEVYRFDVGGRHVSTLDALTGVPHETFAYDGAGLLKSITDRDGRVTSIERDSSGKATAIVAPNGDRTDLTVDANDDLKSVTRPGNLKTTLTYGSGHLLTGETDASGGVHAFDYDTLGYVTKDTDPDGIATSASFSSLAGGQEIKLTEPSGRVRKFFSSGDTAHGYTHKVTHPWGAQTTTDYGPDGSVTATLTDGRTTTIQAGNDPRFGALGRVPADTSVKEPSGLTLDVHRNRTTTLSEPADPFSVSSSSDRWQLGSSQPVFRNYDGATRTFTVTDASGHVDTRTFDAKGHVASIKPDGQSTQTVTTDSQGRAASTAVGDMSESYTYDSKSQLASKTDALNHTTHYTYDAAGRMASVQLPGGQTYQYEHDGLDRLTKLTVPSGAFSQLAYTAAGRPQRFTPPGAGSGYAIGYDNDGEANKVTLPSGRALDFTRDTGGRVSSASYPGATIGVSYTGNDLRPATVTRTPTAGTAQGVAFGWDGDRMTSQTWSGATSGTYDLTYDNNLMLSQSKVTAAGSSYTSAIAHDGDGRVTAQGPFTFTRGGPSGAITAISGGPLSVTQSWDALGRLAGHADTVNAVGTYTSALQRDAAGRITQKTETVAGTTHTFTYAYNANGQVTDVNRDGTNVEHYAYDADGNRTTRTAGGSTQTATYDSAGKITALGGTTYGVDQDGFVTQRGNDTFTYSAHGEILTAAVGGPTETYGYDGLHRLVSRTVAAGTWHYLYGNPEQQFQVTAAIEPSGTLDTLEYTDTGYLFSILRGSTRYYVSTDQVGSPRVVSDANGLVVKNVEYTAWGETTDSAPAFPLPIGFGGGIADPEAGLVHMGIRAYDPKSGRFMARDPIGLGGGAANLWDYAAGDPIQRSDPLGLASGSIGFCEGVCLGGKLAVTSKGLSFCFEVGVGGGGGVEISPAGNLDDNKLYAKASAEASLGPLAGIEISEELSTDGDCTKSTPGAKLCALGACLSTDPEATVDMSKIADLLKKAGHAGIEGKLVEGVCQNLLW